jgi:hypothetical protein
MTRERAEEYRRLAQDCLMAARAASKEDVRAALTEQAAYWLRLAGTDQMGSKSEMAWRTAARLAELAQDTDDDAEREYYIRMRDAWITLANRCEFMPIGDVTARA